MPNILAPDGGKYKEAIDVYNKAISLNQKDYAAIHNLGTTYFMINQVDNALEQFKSLIPLNIEAAYHGLFELLKLDIYMVAELYKNYRFEMSTNDSYEYFTSLISRFLKKGANKQTLFYYKEVIKIVFKSPEQLLIAESFLDVYDKAVFENDKRALYLLPKEQREFFEQEILNSGRQSQQNQE